MRDASLGRRLHLWLTALASAEPGVGCDCAQRTTSDHAHRYGLRGFALLVFHLGGANLPETCRRTTVRQHTCPVGDRTCDPSGRNPYLVISITSAGMVLPETQSGRHRRPEYRGAAAGQLQRRERQDRIASLGVFRYRRHAIRQGEY